MKKFIIGVSVGLVLIGVGLLKGVDKTERIAFGGKDDETQIPHISSKMVTGRKATRLSPAEMSIIYGGTACPCYTCVDGGYAPDCEFLIPGPRCDPGKPCAIGVTVCGSTVRSESITVCGDVASGGKKSCTNNATALCLVWQPCECKLIGGSINCWTTATHLEYSHSACNLSGDDC